MGRVKTIGARLGTVAPRLKQSIAADSWRTSGQTAAQRGYGHKWRVAREAYLKAHPFCAYCLRDAGISYDQPAEAIGIECMQKGVDLPYGGVLDHKIPHRGNMTVFWDSTNWQNLCPAHHSGEKQREERNQA